MEYYSRKYAKLIHTGVRKHFVQVFHILKTALSVDRIADILKNTLSVGRISIWSSMFANDFSPHRHCDLCPK